ncbi:MAG: fused MFS/spermidine synthase [Patescibacteria group bacterium]
MKKIVLGAVFIAGYLIMSLELLGARLLAPYFGNSIYVWASLIGVAMAALAGGYFLGGRLAIRPEKINWLKLAFLIVAVSLLADLFFYRAILESLAGSGAVVGSLIGALILFLIPMVSLAAVSPLAIKELAREGEAGYWSGVIYAVGTIGSLAGVFLTAFYLIPFLGSRLSLFSCLFLALGVLAVLILTQNKQEIFWAGLIFFISFWGLKAPLLPAGVILEEESPYNQLRLVKENGRLFLTLNSLDARIAHSVFSETREAKDYYLKGLFSLGPMLAAGQKVLILGLGAGATLKQQQALFPGLKIDAVEIDPKIIALAKDYFFVQESSALKIYEADARPYLRASATLYDVIEIDLFQGSPYIPFYVVSQEFFQQVLARLNEGGVMTMNILTLDQPELMEPILNTIRSVFPSVFIVPTGGNILAIATSKPTELDQIKEKMSVVAGQEEALKEVVVLANEAISVYQPKKTNLVFTDDWAPIEMITHQMLKNANYLN